MWNMIGNRVIREMIRRGGSFYGSARHGNRTHGLGTRVPGLAGMIVGVHEEYTTWGNP